MELGGYTLRPNQVALYEFMKVRRRALAIHKMRTGKTLPTAQIVKENIEKLGHKALVVAPPETIQGWTDAFNSLNAPMDKIHILSTGIVSHYKLKEIKEMFKDWDYKTIVLDEIHYYRNHSTRFKNVKWLAMQATHRYGLTGTPFDKDVAEFFYVVQLLDDGKLLGTNKKEFESYMCDRVPNSDLVKMRPEWSDKLMVELKKFTQFYETTEVKPPDEIFHKYDLNSVQKRWVICLRHDMGIPEIDNEHSQLTAFHKNNKILQVLSGFYIRASGDIMSIGISPKWLCLYKLVKKLGGARIVVWVQFVKEYELAKAALAEFRVEKYTKANLNLFREQELDILLVHPASVGVGVDISCANHAIFVNHTTSGIDNAQAYYRLSKFDGEDIKTVHHLVPNEPTAKKRVSTIRGKIQKIRKFNETHSIHKTGRL